MTELRNVGSQPPRRDGALTKAPAPFLLHAVGAAPVPSMRAPVLAGLAEIRAAAATADVGHDAASFAEGLAGREDALPEGAWLRLENIRTAINYQQVYHTDPIQHSRRDSGMTITMIGATGQQGSAVIDALIDRNASVRAVTRNPHSDNTTELFCAWCRGRTPAI